MGLFSLFILCRFFHFAALMQLFGATLYIALLAPKTLRPTMALRLRTLISISVIISTVTSIAMLALQAGQMGDGWRDVLQPSTWQMVLGTTFGQVWQWHCLLALCSVLALCLLRGQAQTSILLLLSLFLLASLGLIGHAAIQSGIWGMVHRVNHALHLLSAGFWIGGLLPFLLCISYSRTDTHRIDAIYTMIRFSTYGHLAVAIVILTGLVNTLFTLPAITLNLASEYQQLLFIKVIFVFIMLGQAIYNRYRIIPRIKATPERALKTLGYGSIAELAFGVGVLLLVSAFAMLEPL